MIFVRIMTEAVHCLGEREGGVIIFFIPEGVSSHKSPVMLRVSCADTRLLL